MAKNLLTSLSAEEKARIMRWSRQAYEPDGGEKKPRKIYRKGKTKNDRNHKRQEQTQQNRDARVAWQHTAKATIDTFPWQACNGKRNRRVITGRGIIERQRVYGGR